MFSRIKGLSKTNKFEIPEGEVLNLNESVTPIRGLSDEEKVDWLCLIRSDHVGPQTFYTLLRHFGSAANALEVLPDLRRQGGVSTDLKTFTRENAYKELETHHKNGADIITPLDADYPLTLQALADKPPVLSIIGQRSVLKAKMVSIVGARNASLNGKKFAHHLSQGLVESGYVVVSGLARGIDASAHQGALAAQTPGSPKTLAFVAGGLGTVYPLENKALFEKIPEEGAILSEAPWGTAPQAHYFPRRNRLVSGISKGVVIIEAAQKSGSLITARYALDQGRELMVVPGSPQDPRCKGSNALLKEGAAMVQSLQDILEVLAEPSIEVVQEAPAAFELPPPRVDESELGSARDQVIENLGITPTTLDELIRVCNFSSSTILRIILELELAGRLQRLPGNRVVLLS